MGRPLILSLFPGIDLLGLAFEQVWPECCIVRGPDLIFGSLHDIRAFHPPSGIWDGIIAGPPCQMFSRLAHMVRHNGYEPRFGNLIPEFERVVAEAQPRWFLMENVEAAPHPIVEGYIVDSRRLNNRYFGAEQSRLRRFSFGTRDGRPLIVDVALFEHPLSVTAGDSSDSGGAMRGRRPLAVVHDPHPVPVAIGGSGKRKPGARVPFSVTARHAGRVPWVPGSDTAGHGGENSKQYVYGLEDACELQGLPRDFTDDMPFTKAGKLQAVANGVPLPMGRAVAQAVRRAMEVP